MARPLSIVVAVAENGVIGRDNKLVWRLKSDLKRFRDLTMGKPMIMGRKTFDSIGRKLPGRESVVLTRDPDFSLEGIHVAHAWDEALARADRLADAMGADEIPVIGGADLFRLALPLAARLHLTLVHARPQGDVFLPDYAEDDFRELGREHRGPGPDDEFAVTFIDLERSVAPLRR